ncbi:MAG: hypothetical protein A2072_07150 [Nitrospirae bacterium GWC1_57_7]|nr:MAG: hypothetical protein A2072_07150 [Nitrospirae bacterium GWC1_57_7]OGW46236.1 MAG: hypothetical protein A2X57_05635 [Nitrospirae bacterium GWD2_57_8]HAR44782.1 hypothetical protein [Nitrospiraceae bacterium]
MSDSAWWADIIQWVVWGLAMTVIMGWLAKSRQKAGVDTGKVLQHPRSTLIIGLVCGGFFLALAVLSRLFPGKDGSIWISLFFLGFSLMGAVIIVEYVRVRHHLEPHGLRFQPLFRAPGTLLWRDVSSVRYSPSAKWFRIETRRGQVIRVSAMLTGLPAFAQAALQEISPPSMDSATRRILEETAAGRPPSLWE